MTPFNSPTKIAALQRFAVQNLSFRRRIATTILPFENNLEISDYPSYKFLKTFLISDQRVISILKHKPWIFLENLSKNVVPNIDLLRDIGMPESSIARLLAHYPNILIKKKKKPESFSGIVAEVKDFGLEPAICAGGAGEVR
ncbi:hypothetical protein COP2_032090 [Malus domestica]